MKKQEILIIGTGNIIGKTCISKAESELIIIKEEKSPFESEPLLITNNYLKDSIIIKNGKELRRERRKQK